MKNRNWILIWITKYKWMMTLSVLLLIVQTGAEMGMTGLQKWLVDDVLVQGQYGKLPMLIGLFILAFIGYAIMFTVTPTVMRNNEFGLRINLQQQVLDTLQKIPFGAFRKQPTTKYVQNSTSDASNAAFTVAMYIPDGIQQILTAIFLTLFVGYTSPILLLVVFVISICFYLLGKYQGPMAREISKEVQGSKTEFLVHVEEGVASTREIVAYHRHEWELGVLNRVFGRYLGLVGKEAKFQNKVSFSSEPLKWGATLTILVYGAFEVMKGSITIGLFVVAYQFASQLITSYQQVFEFAMNIYGQKAYFDRLNEVLAQTWEAEGTKRIDASIRSIELVDVSFAYQEDTKDVLQHVSIDFAIGKKIAIVGSSGSGESTLAQLLVRLYDQTQGAIRVNGMDLNEIVKSDWLQRVAYVPQEPYFFPETIRENLTLGHESVSDEQLENACEVANIVETIGELDEGYDTLIGERGISLSGGQRQRLAIARAILTNPEILVLDEATSALDTESERLVQQALDKSRQGLTTIVIAHRLSTIENADIIYVMDNGSVIEVGTHDELLSNGNKYKDLFTSQMVAS